ncbi:MAG: CBS and ACT domain-containing protein [Desulfomonile sp.]|nr:CBS and ACT domain-containing protein [Desulfomonile sp.]
MLVKYCMRRQFLTLTPDDPLRKAVQFLKKHNVCMLPVMEGKKLVGVVSERHLRRVLGLEKAFETLQQWSGVDPETRVGEIMAPDVITVSPEDTLEDVLRLMMERKILGAPVMNAQGELVGVITQADLHRVFLAVSDLTEKGVQFAFELEDRPGSLKEVTDIIRQHGGRIATILTSYETAPVGFRHAYIRVFALDRDRIPKLREELASKARLLYGAPAEV